MSTTFTAELKLLVRSFVRWIAVVAIVAAIFFAIGFEKRTLLGVTVHVPVVTMHSIAAIVFEKMAHDLVPASVQLVVTNPLDAFIIETEIAFVLTFALLLPFLIYAIARYISPALYRYERQSLFFVVLPSIVLFFGGVLFSYIYIIPNTFAFLYLYVPSIGATPLFLASDFVATTLSLLVSTGVMFQLPIAMILLTFLGIIQASFWRNQWRYAVLAFLVATAIITPDGSGVTMLLLSAPLTLLYGVGLVVSEYHV